MARKAVWHILAMHLLTLIVLSAIRAYSLCELHDMFYAESLTDYPLWAKALMKGVRLDNVALGYINMLPALTVALCALLRREVPCKGTFAYLCTTHLMFCAVALASIPYYREYGFDISADSLAWLFSGREVTQMLLTAKYAAYFIILGVLGACYYAMSRCRPLRRTIRLRYELGGLLLFLCLAIYGRPWGTPLNCRNAYFCEDPTLNHCAQSPALYLMTTAVRGTDKTAQLCEEEALKEYIQTYYPDAADSLNPWHQTISGNTKAPYHGRRPNVVLIMMESMSVHYMDAFNAGNGLTPFLDSLYRNSLHYSQCYSVGYRTSQGLAGTLCSVPAYLNNNTTIACGRHRPGGIAQHLKQQGYATSFYMPHSDSYDGLDTFLRANGFDEIYSRKNYPQSAMVNMWGVPDDYLYSYAIRRLTEQSEAASNPFFSVIMSVSNHEPYVVPAYYTPRRERDAESQEVEYADWSLRQFFEQARRAPWYANTVFVLVGDHGRRIGASECEVPDAVTHVPLIVCGTDIEPCHVSRIVSQADVQRILLSEVLGQTFTTDGLIPSRPLPYVCYCVGTYMVCRSSTHLLIYRYDNGDKLYYALAPSRKPQRIEPTPQLRAMETYLLATYEIMRRQLRRWQSS